MTNEEKAARLALSDLRRCFEQHRGRIAELEAERDAQLFREREEKSLLTGPDWKGMYEAQEREMAALRKEREGLVADRDTATSYADSLRQQLREAQQQMAADAMLIAEAQKGAEIVADTERRLERRITELESYLEDVEAHLRDCRARGRK